MEEKSIWSGNSSQIVNLGAFVLSGLAFSALLAALVVLWEKLRPLGPAALAPAFVILLVPPAYALIKIILVKSLRYEVTSERIKITSGILSKKCSALELYRVKDYTLEAPFFFRLFRLGNVNILTSDRSNPEIVLRAVPRARKLMDDIRTHVELRRDQKRVREVDFDQAGDIVEN
ncbi:MAG: PH domain-containing protein [Acidobacteria bacterium]|jgi:uncharacterized membrane protein YdbT with pleckstrin-like domain|nr:PH domain-containing protein [Acidobacteriota bacterium]